MSHRLLSVLHCSPSAWFPCYYRIAIFILKAREEEMTSKVNDLQTQLEELQKKYEHRLDQEESAEDNVRGL